MRLAQRLTEAACWRIAAELVRRHPDLEVREFFWRIPGAGPPGRYVMLLGRERRWIHVDLMNANGATHLLQDFGALLTASDVRTVVEELEVYFRLTSPPSTPVTTSRSIGFRLVAEILTRRLFERNTVTARPCAVCPARCPGCGEARQAIGSGFSSWRVVRYDAGDADNEPLLDRIVRPAGYRSGPLPDSPEEFWMRAPAMVGECEGVLVDPRKGLAVRSDGRVLDLYRLYCRNGRSLGMTSLAVFG